MSGDAKGLVLCLVIERCNIVGGEGSEPLSLYSGDGCLSATRSEDGGTLKDRGVSGWLV